MTSFLNVIGWFVLIVGVVLWVTILMTGLSNLRNLRQSTAARGPAAPPIMPAPAEQAAPAESPPDTKAE